MMYVFTGWPLDEIIITLDTIYAHNYSTKCWQCQIGKITVLANSFVKPYSSLNTSISFSSFYSMCNCSIMSTRK